MKFRKIFSSPSAAGKSSIIKDGRPSPVQVVPAEEIGDKDRVNTLESKIESLSRELSEQRNLISNLIYQVEFFKVSLPIIEKLGHSITETTERVNIELTENIYKITRESEKASKQICNLLESITTGKSGLIADSDKLASISQKVTELSKNYEKEMVETGRETNRIEETISKIYNFTENITDIAEQTSVLAINASIEAARAGIHGKGFKVIAREVHSLSSESKNIAVNIIEMVKELKVNTHSYFSEHVENLKDYADMSNELDNELSDVSNLINTQARIVEMSGKESKELSDAVKKDINSIAYSLQYQDITRQQIENIIKILDGMMTNFNEVLKTADYDTQINYEELEKKVKELAEVRFTVRDEYKAIDKNINEDSNIADRKKQIVKEELKGDITLF
ncbi:MAG: hypothetical protein GXP33_11060 [Spirochaetes bacterium]|nr:hypothetical protein [Spirochaetota bacterium]